METVGVEILKEECGSFQEIIDPMSDADRRQLRLRRQNIRDLRTLQKVIMLEEKKPLSIDDVLARALAFYGKFVPFKEGTGK
jgi:hypothetical protein